MTTGTKSYVRFGDFELDTRTRELRTDGRTFKLQEQPFQVLITLLERPGELITREELKRRLWPSDTFVDFERSINKIVNRLRESLGDSADNSTYIETLPRSGYRFIAPVVKPQNSSSVSHLRQQWWVWCLALGSALAVVLLILTLHKTTLPSTERVVSVARLTHDPEFSDWPTWSADGSTIAFSSNRTSDFEIYIRRVDGGREVNITNDPGQDIQPDFSPDGSQVVFVSTRSSRTGLIKIGSIFGPEFRTYGGDVWMVPALGGQARLLAKDGNFPVWHPNGKKVLFISGVESHRSLMEVETDSGRIHPVLSPERSHWEITRAHYSPKGDWITFETFERELFIIPAVGVGTLRALLKGVSCHAWSPSNKLIYYCVQELSGGTRLEAVAVNERTGNVSGGASVVGVVTGNLRDLAVSRDGRRLAASEMESSLNLTRLPLTPNGGSPNGPEEVLSTGPVFDREPSVSPDGGSVIYTSDRLGHDELYVLHLGDKHAYRLQLPGNDLGVDSPQWFPDGRRLVVLRRMSIGKDSLWMVSRDGSRAEEIFSSPAIWGLEIPISPDNRTIVFPQRVGEIFQLFAIDSSTRKLQQITFNEGDKYSGSWSPDGRWLLYSSNASGTVQLWKMAASGGTTQQLTRGDQRIHHAFYSPNGRWIYFQPNHQNFYRMPANGGSPQQVTRFSETGLFIEEPTISADGRYLYYCRGNGGSSLWLLDLSK
jgi:Tol biopolymer transport system component/DNA-binding winged helix-turn-helix (wHTH) protein